VLIDRAGWHVADEVKIPANITLIYLPPPAAFRWLCQQNLGRLRLTVQS
jgi:hypothetical protein